MEEDTSFQLSTSEHDGIVEIILSGEVTKDTLDRLRAEVITILREKNAKAVLYDVCSLKGPNVIADAYVRARSVPADTKRLPSALVTQSKNRSYQSFYETTAANAGQTMRFFTDIETARAWLSGKLKE